MQLILHDWPVAMCVRLGHSLQQISLLPNQQSPSCAQFMAQSFPRIHSSVCQMVPSVPCPVQSQPASRSRPGTAVIHCDQHKRRPSSQPPHERIQRCWGRSCRCRCCWYWHWCRFTGLACWCTLRGCRFHCRSFQSNSSLPSSCTGVFFCSRCFITPPSVGQTLVFHLSNSTGSSSGSRTDCSSCGSVIHGWQPPAPFY